MVELNHNVANINADGLVKGGHGVLIAVHVSKSGSSGAKCVLKNGITSSAAAEVTVYGETVQDVDDLNRRFENGIYADVTGSAEYIIVFK
jgi:hypothetical protein